jgi:hypothetical protein
MRKVCHFRMFRFASPITYLDDLTCPTWNTDYFHYAILDTFPWSILKILDFLLFCP